MGVAARESDDAEDAGGGDGAPRRTGPGRPPFGHDCDEERTDCEGDAERRQLSSRPSGPRVSHVSS